MGDYVALNPVRRTGYNHSMESLTGQLGDLTHKRVAGGRAQFGLMGFEDIADAIIPVTEGFDKQKKSPYKGKGYVLERVLKGEHGIPLFDKAVLIAGIRKYAQDPKDGFLPLGPGSTDIEAGLQPDGPWVHRELQIYGIPEEPNEDFLNLITSKTGLATDYGNLGDSIEIVVPMYTPGKWREIKDLEFARPAGMVIVTPYCTLWSEGLSINNTYEGLRYPSGKIQDAINIARQVSRELGLK